LKIALAGDVCVAWDEDVSGWKCCRNLLLNSVDSFTHKLALTALEMRIRFVISLMTVELKAEE